MRPFAQILPYAGLILMGLAAASPPAWATDPPPPFPPGVSLEAAPANLPQALGYSAQSLRIDWTEPLLNARLVDYGTDNAGPTPAAERLEQLENVPVLRIQLSEPRDVPAPAAGSPIPPPPALPIMRAGASGTTQEMEKDGSLLALMPAGGWVPTGRAVADKPEYQSPWAEGCDRAAVRWLGRGADLETMPALEFGGFCLIGITRPRTGQTRFTLVQRDQPGPGRLSDLGRWLRESVPPDDWIAVHSFGQQAWAGMQGWRLKTPGDPRRIQRAGAMLELRTKQTGEPVDWARLPGVQVQASGFEEDFPPSRALSGRLWPRPLDPDVWMSRSGTDSGSPVRIELRFATARPIERIVAAWAGAAGWSAHFNPGLCLLQVSETSDAEPRTVLEVKAPDKALTVWKAPAPMSLRRIRLVYPKPSRDGLDPRARLAALQAWGPWDGRTGLRESADRR